MGIRVGAALLAAAVAAPLAGQAPGRLDLVRCASGSDAPCFLATASGVPAQVVSVGADGVDGLGRGALRRTLTVRTDAGSGARVFSWRPPLIAMPAFTGVADSSLLSPAVRDALIAGSIGGSNRPVILLLLSALLGCGWLALVRLGWNDPDQLQRRERDHATRTGIAGAPVEAAPPRTPEDVTRHTARRTALRR